MSKPLDELTANLAKKLENNSDDIPGWTLLGCSYIVTGHPDKAISAFKKTIALSPNEIELRISLGEALVTASNGKVTPEAKQIFLEAEKMQEDHPGVKFNVVLADFQEGEIKKAYGEWLILAQSAPPSASWLKDV